MRLLLLLTLLFCPFGLMAATQISPAIGAAGDNGPPIEPVEQPIHGPIFDTAIEVPGLLGPDAPIVAPSMAPITPEFTLAQQLVLMQISRPHDTNPAYWLRLAFGFASLMLLFSALATSQSTQDHASATSLKTAFSLRNRRLIVAP